MATTPQSSVDWYHRKKASEAVVALTDRLAKAEHRIEELEATVSHHELTVIQLVAAVRKLQAATRR
jgi:hypothetical protein